MNINYHFIGICLSLFLFLSGFFILMFRRNIIFMMLALEIMFNAANVLFIVGNAMTGAMDGQVVVFFVMGVAACEAAIGLAMIIWLHRTKSSLHIEDFSLLKG